MFSQSNPATDGFCLRVSEGPEMLELDFVSRRDSKVHDRRKRVGTSKARGSGEAAKRNPVVIGEIYGDIIRMGILR